VEHVASLRLIPNMDVWRPADTTETALAWAAAIERKNGPTSLILSRQNLPFLSKPNGQIDAIRKGAYVLSDCVNAKAVIIGTGSEVHLALEAQKQLAQKGIPTRVVSMPSTTVFDRQDARYKASVLPPGIPRIAVEAGVTDFWWKYRCDAVVGIDTFGESAPAGVLFKHFALTADNVARTVEDAVRVAQAN
jgi:transketolase